MGISGIRAVPAVLPIQQNCKIHSIIYSSVEISTKTLKAKILVIFKQKLQAEVGMVTEQISLNVDL